MEVYDFYENPVPHCIIKNYYQADDVEMIHKELDKLKPMFKPPEETGTARGVDNIPRKSNKGVFIENQQHPIVKLNSKIFSPEVIHELCKHSWLFKYLRDTRDSSTLVSHYSEGDFYKAHEDKSFFTAIYYTWKEPKPFEGGDILLEGVKAKVENNSLLIFPSKTRHTVTPVTKGSGRYAITQFINFQGPERRLPIDKFMNFMDVREFNDAKNLIFNSREWAWAGRSGQKHDEKVKFWHLDLGNHHLFAVHLKNKIEALVGAKFDLERVYANGQTFGQDGYFHQDCTNNRKQFTFLVYLNPISDNEIDDWGGETQFQDGDRIVSYPPVTNSALYFDAHLFHRGLSPKRFVPEMRVTVAWKLILREDNNSM
jgi:hypothetical protein